MEVKVFTTNSPEEAEGMRVDMEATGFTVLICDKSEIVSITCENLANGSTAVGNSSWIVIGKIT
jgi:hypothetical protein